MTEPPSTRDLKGPLGRLCCFDLQYLCHVTFGPFGHSPGLCSATQSSPRNSTHRPNFRTKGRNPTSEPSSHDEVLHGKAHPSSVVPGARQRARSRHAPRVEATDRWTQLFHMSGKIGCFRKPVLFGPLRRGQKKTERPLAVLLPTTIFATDLQMPSLHIP